MAVSLSQGIREGRFGDNKARSVEKLRGLVDTKTQWKTTIVSGFLMETGYDEIIPANYMDEEHAKIILDKQTPVYFKGRSLRLGCAAEFMYQHACIFLQRADDDEEEDN